MGAAVARAEAISTAPAAIVVASPLAAMQAKRSLPSAHDRLFHELRKSKTWLFREWTAQKRTA
ncbi:hypothetical protein AB5I41_29480 [Sphingomonas sp. MMS24-JH45]